MRVGLKCVLSTLLITEQFLSSVFSPAELICMNRGDMTWPEQQVVPAMFHKQLVFFGWFLELTLELMCRFIFSTVSIGLRVPKIT